MCCSSWRDLKRLRAGTLRIFQGQETMETKISYTSLSLICLRWKKRREWRMKEDPEKFNFSFWANKIKSHYRCKLVLTLHWNVELTSDEKENDFLLCQQTSKRKEEKKEKSGGYRKQTDVFIKINKYIYIDQQLCRQNKKDIDNQI